jgi:hypothetical protein
VGLLRAFALGFVNRRLFRQQFLAKALGNKITRFGLGLLRNGGAVGM